MRERHCPPHRRPRISLRSIRATLAGMWKSSSAPGKHGAPVAYPPPPGDVSTDTMAPTILRDGAVRLFFFSREEPRMHVHVAHPEVAGKFRMHRALSRPISRRSPMPGSSISAPELTHVSLHGFWLRMNDEEFLLPFAEFPWFRHATIEQLSAIERPTADHLFWPLLDVDVFGGIRCAIPLPFRLSPRCPGDPPTG